MINQNTVPPKPDPELEIYSNPSGADIYIDNEYIAKTPRTVIVTEGTHTVTFKLEGYQTIEKTVTVSLGEVLKINADLHAIKQPDNTIFIIGAGIIIGIIMFKSFYKNK